MKSVPTRRIVQGSCFVLFAALVLFPAAAPALTILFGADIAAVLSASLASRTWSLAAWISALALVTATVWGRFYCNQACPMGALQDFVDFGLGKRPVRHLPSFVPYIVLAAVAVLAGLGFNLAYWISPLPLLSETLGLTSPLRRSFVGAVVLVAVVGLGLLLGPRAYCRVLCPSGALYALAQRVGRVWKRRKRGPKPISLERRQALCLLAAGPLLAPTGAEPGSSDVGAEPLRPPGGLPHERLATLCVRCGACVAACPTDAISAATVIGSRSLEARAPVFVPRRGPCLDGCRACQDACPTGALGEPLRWVRGHPVLGLAKVERARCVAISGSAACLVCYSACAIGAISLRPTGRVAPWGDSIFEPVVNAELCHGCGHCEHRCPVEGKAAIRVFPPEPLTKNL